MVITIGDIYWLHTESEDEIPHPHVIIFTDDQHTLFVMYALTTNMKKLASLEIFYWLWMKAICPSRVLSKLAKYLRQINLN